MNALNILGFEPVNQVTDPIKMENIKKSIKNNGWRGAPILTYGNTLITGSHRLFALRKLSEEGFDLLKLGEEVAFDVSSIIESEENAGKNIYDYLDGGLKSFFQGTWVEDYKDEIEW